MHLDRRAHHNRLQDMSFDLLDGQHDQEHPERDPGTVVHQRQEHGDGAGHDRTHDRDERAEEHQDGDRERERHLQQERPESDADRIDRRDEQLRARVVHDRGPAVAGRSVDGRLRHAREDPEGPPPDACAVGEETDQDEQRQHGARGDVADGGPDRQGAGPQHLRLLVEEVESLLQVVRDLRVGETQRTLVQPDLELIEGLGRTLLHVGQLSTHLPDDEPHQPGDDGGRPDERDGDRQPARETTPQHPREGRPQQRGDEDAHHEGDDQELEQHHEPDEDADRRRDQQQPPGIARRDAQWQRYRLVGLGRHGALGGDRARTEQISQSGSLVLTHRPSLRSRRMPSNASFLGGCMSALGDTLTV
eukprot:Opistho-1_new@51779